LKTLVEDCYPKYEVWATRESLEWLTLLHAGTKESLRAQELELAQCKEDPWRFLTHWAITEDSQNEEHPFQPFPNELHLQILAKYWQQEQFLLVPKSRQMTCTWLFCGLYLWHSMFFPSRLTVFQCKIEEDSDANLGRVHTMWERLPDWMKAWQPMHRTFCNAKFPRSRSEIRAVAAGSKHYRQRTLSGVFSDESSFTEDFAEIFGAAKSSLGRVGKFTAVSSAQPGDFALMVADKDG
jgi:hypothetical protein